LATRPALGAALLPEWQETQVAPPRLLWSTLASPLAEAGRGARRVAGVASRCGHVLADLPALVRRWCPSGKWRSNGADHVVFIAA